MHMWAKNKEWSDVQACRRVQPYLVLHSTGHITRKTPCGTPLIKR